MTQIIERFPSSSSASVVHEVKDPGDGGPCWCSCMGWKTSKTDPKSCTHLKKMAADGRLSAGFTPSGVASAPPVLRSEPVTKPSLLLAHSWEGQPLKGWLLSEKLDGVRALWDGSKFISRGGVVYNAPAWFTAGLPDYLQLDGELWMGRGRFQELSGAVRRLQPTDELWRQVRFLVFDAPSIDAPFEQRVEAYTLAAECSEYVEAVPQVICEDNAHMQSYLQDVIGGGGEGLMARRPSSRYEGGRSTSLLKIKQTIDAEALAVGHQPGEGRCQGMLGALELEFPNGVKFRCGTGFSDAQRSAPPSIGSQVTIRYQELSKDGVPRFPAFVCERNYE